MVFFNRHGWGRALLLTAIVMVGVVCMLGCGGNATTAANGTHPTQAQQQKKYTGDGGKGISLTVYVPQSTGLAEKQSYIPALVQGEFVSNFSNYSAISILDWERLDDIYIKLVNEAYDDNAEAKQNVVLGRLAPTSHFLTGNITKTETGYNIKMNITSTADKMTVATYSGTFSFVELDNLTGIRRASLELLQKVGVELTENARQELFGAATANQVSAQTALAKGVTAQRAGTEVAALSYYYQAANFNPMLNEAVKRSSVVAANISSGNIGADVRNDIVWRKNWVGKLKETEDAYHEMIENAAPPYTLVYFTNIKTGNVNYQNGTVDLSIIAGLNANMTWFTAMRQVAQVVLDGLNATKRKSDWGLAKWPQEGVSNTNPFASKKQYDIAAVFELVNQQGRVIGSQTVQQNPAFSITRNNNDRLFVEFDGGDFVTVNFNGVRADDISDNLIIRIASINDESPQEARFAITARTALVEKTSPFTDVRNGRKYNTVRIGGKVWMAENLNYQPKEGNSTCHPNCVGCCMEYGRLYDWNTAMDVCPIGWHLPSRGEWSLLVSFAGGENAGKKLKTQRGWRDTYDNPDNGTDDFGFSAKPGSGGQIGFDGIYRVGVWWTATRESDDYAYAWLILQNKVMDGREEVSYGCSVRCVMDD